MTKQNTQNVLNASRERMSELLSDFKKLNFDSNTPRLTLNLTDSSKDLHNASPHTKSSVENEDSIELVKAYESPLKLVALYIGDLDPGVTEEKLYRFFSNYETLSTVKICYLPGSKTSLCYGYVNFGSEKDARKALEELNYRPLMNKEVRIMPSMKGKDKAFLGTNVFVSNLNTDKVNTLRAFYETFRSYGPILSCKLDLAKRQGFISFEDKETAHEFVKETDETIIHGTKIHCTIHVPKSVRSSSVFKPNHLLSSTTSLFLADHAYSENVASPAVVFLKSAPVLKTSSRLPSAVVKSEALRYPESLDQSSPGGFKQVYVKGLPLDITEEELKATFSKCGPVTDVFLQNVVEFKSAWAMITFQYASSAFNATSEFHRLVYRGRKLTCVKALKRNERMLQLSVKVPSITINKSKPHQKLYLYNLPPTVNENFFKLFLRGYTLQGAIIRFFISPKAQSSFIDFEKQEDAKAALLRLNGIDLSGHILKASLTKIEPNPELEVELEDLSSLKTKEDESRHYQLVSAPVKEHVEAPIDRRFGSRTSSVAFFPPRFFPSPQLPGPSHVVQDQNGSVYRLIPVPASLYSSESARGSNTSPILTRSSSFKELPDAHKGIDGSSGSVLVTLEKMAPRFIEFLKYPSATRPKNLRRILEYFVDAYDREDPSLIKNDIERIQRGDAFTETLLRERLIQTIELMGFNR